MLTGAFIITLILILLWNYFFVELPRRRAAPPEPTFPDPIPPVEATQTLPEGASLQPTLTWTRPGAERSIFLGIHPLLISLVGTPFTLKLVPEDWQVWKGVPLIRIKQGRRELRVPSPVNGRVVEVNPVACGERGGVHPEKGEGCWVYRIQAVDLAEEAPGWLTGDQAREELGARYREMRDLFLQAQPARGRVSRAAADTELPIGVLADLHSRTWEEFQEQFLPTK